jgi:hypothetical protein
MVKYSQLLQALHSKEVSTVIAILKACGSVTPGGLEKLIDRVGEEAKGANVGSLGSSVSAGGQFSDVKLLKRR